MINHDLIEELAGLLNVDTQESGRLLNAFFSAMVTGLLAERKLSVKGLGSFSVSHVPLKKKNNASGITYTPPCNQLKYENRLSGADDTACIVTLRHLTNPSEVEPLARAFAQVFSNAFTQQREIRINGLGRFSKDQGAYGFLPERSLEELLNREYQNLEEVVLPLNETLQSSNGSKERKKSRYAIPLSVLFVLSLLVAYFYFDNPESKVSVPAPLYQESKLKPVVQKPQAEAVSLKELSGSSVADSLVLQKGEYTIVLETFRMEQTALKEMNRLRSQEIVAYVWPGTLNREKYFRLMTGKFSNRDGAKEYLKGMPKKILGGAYIQQVLKKGVFHGGKGL